MRFDAVKKPITSELRVFHIKAVYEIADGDGMAWHSEKQHELARNYGAIGFSLYGVIDELAIMLPYGGRVCFRHG